MLTGWISSVLSRYHRDRTQTCLSIVPPRQLQQGEATQFLWLASLMAAKIPVSRHFPLALAPALDACHAAVSSAGVRRETAAQEKTEEWL